MSSPSSFPIRTSLLYLSIVLHPLLVLLITLHPGVDGLVSESLPLLRSSLLLDSSVNWQSNQSWIRSIQRQFQKEKEGRQQLVHRLEYRRDMQFLSETAVVKEKSRSQTLGEGIDIKMKDGIRKLDSDEECSHENGLILRRNVQRKNEKNQMQVVEGGGQKQHDREREGSASQENDIRFLHHNDDTKEGRGGEKKENGQYGKEEEVMSKATTTSPPTTILQGEGQRRKWMKRRRRNTPTATSVMESSHNNGNHRHYDWEESVPVGKEYEKIERGRMKHLPSSLHLHRPSPHKIVGTSRLDDNKAVRLQDERHDDLKESIRLNRRKRTNGHDEWIRLTRQKVSSSNIDDDKRNIKSNTAPDSRKTRKGKREPTEQEKRQAEQNRQVRTKRTIIISLIMAGLFILCFLGTLGICIDKIKEWKRKGRIIRRKEKRVQVNDSVIISDMSHESTARQEAESDNIPKSSSSHPLTFQPVKRVEGGVPVPVWTLQEKTPYWIER